MSSDFVSFALLRVRDFLSENFIILLVPLLVVIGWRLWIYLRNTLFLDAQKWTMLEVRLPRDVFKSPEAMEIVLINALYQTGGVGTWFDRYWKGNLRAWFSLEIVSLGGRIHFFIRTLSKFKGLVETQIYAQYPQAEVTETDDYTDFVPPFDKKGDWGVWGANFVLTKADAYPIKTYVDYGLDKRGTIKEEERIDPITPMMEFFGSLGPDEQAWFQIVVRADTNRYGKGEDGKALTWKKVAEGEIKKLKDKFKKEEGKEIPMKTKADEEMINALERSIQKVGFDCGIVAMYLAKKDSFNGNNITAFISSLRQYNSTSNLNGFKPKNATAVDYPWQDLTGNVVAKKKSDILELYRSRGYFYPHFDPFNLGHYINEAFKDIETPIILNSEELATIYHFPGRVAETPAFKRVDSKKSEPPENLPI